MKKEINKFMSYFCVGGMAALVEWGTFYIFNKFCNFNISTIIAFISATTFNYFLGRNWTFKNDEKKEKDALLVFIVSFIGLVFNILLMNIMIKVLKTSYELLCKIIATGIVFFWNYLSRRLFIYKDKKDEKEL